MSMKNWVKQRSRLGTHNADDSYEVYELKEALNDFTDGWAELHDEQKLLPKRLAVSALLGSLITVVILWFAGVL